MVLGWTEALREAGGDDQALQEKGSQAQLWLLTSLGDGRGSWVWTFEINQSIHQLIRGKAFWEGEQLCGLPVEEEASLGEQFPKGGWVLLFDLLGFAQ